MKIEGIPDSMLACQIVEYNKPHQIREISTPKALAAHDLLLKVAVASICHSDLEYLYGHVEGVELPVTGSHEGTGVVVSKGSAVTAFGIGDRVLAGQTYGRCGHCDDCRGPEHNRHYCDNLWNMMSVKRDGAWQEYLIADARQASKIPDQMSFLTVAPLACAGVTAWRGLLNAELKPGQWVGIVGSGGGLGHLCIQFAKALDLKVVGVDARDDGIALSKESGADVVLDARKGKVQVVEEVFKATEGRGVDATVNVSDARSAAGTACAMTRKHGTMVQVALALDMAIPHGELIFRDIRVRGSFICSQNEIESMLDTVVKHDIKVKSTVFYGIKKIPKVVGLLEKGQYQGKGVIVMDEKVAL